MQVGNVNINVTPKRLIWHVAGDAGEDRSLRLLHSLLHPTLDVQKD